MTQLIFPAIINTAGSTSGQYLKNENGTAVWADVATGSDGTWGSITGDITDQIDLGNALAAKLELAATTTYTRSLLAAVDAPAARSLLGIIDTVEGLDPLALTTSLIPAVDNVYSLGSAEKRWKDIFVSANTIYLGDSTVLSGTSITIEPPASATSLSEIPTLRASKIIAQPYVYNPGGGAVTVRPSIEFQIGGDSYPISLNTESLEFSLDAKGNYGTGSLVAKKVSLTNPAGLALVLSGGIAHAGSYLNTSTTDTFRFDGNVTLGYDSTRTVTLKGQTVFEGGVQFKGAASLGDGNDAITINSGVNPTTISASNLSIDASGNLILQGNLTVQGTTTTINSNTLNVGDNIIVLNSDVGGGDTPTQNAGIQVARGEESAARWLWNETTDVWSPMGGDIGGVGTISATSFIGNLTGAATSAARLTTPRLINGVSFDGSADITISAGQSFNLTDGTKGEITVSQGGTVWTIDANVITTAKMQQVATDTFLGRDTAGSGNLEVLSVATVRSMLGVSSVNNTSDAEKPVSTATQAALATKVPKGLISEAELTMSPGALLGRSDPSTGSVEEIVVGNGLTLSGSELSVTFTDNGWGTTVSAIGTAAPQNIELPEGGLTPLDVLVFNDGVRYYSDEYTITGTTLQMTSNYAGDKIEIIKLPTRTVLTQFQPARSVMSEAGAQYTPSSTATTRYVRMTSSDPITVTIPDAFSVGTELVFEQAGTGVISIVGANGVAVVSRGNRIQSAGRYAVVNVKKVDATMWVITGDVI